MTHPLKIFCIRKEEKWLAVVALLVFVGLNALMLSSHWHAYTEGHMGGFWTVFTQRFCVSGYDCWAWLTISEGRVIFQTVRHPLYLSFLYPMYWLNHWLMGLTDVNFAIFFVGLVLVASAVYSSVFMYRILREVMELEVFDARLLTALLFSFAHVMLATMVPDHFVISMFLLLMTLYIAGICMKRGRQLPTWTLSLLAFFTCGIAVSNVAKTFLAAWFVNGKRFFSARNLMLGVLLPLGLLAAIQRYQYHAIEVPLVEKNKQVMKSNPPKDKGKHDRQVAQTKQWRAQNDMKAAGDGIFKLMDFETSRMRTLADNFFGESFQLHQDYLLKDVLVSRPMFVGYRHVYSWVVEILLVLLFAAGIGWSIRYRFFLMVLAWFGCDVMLNLVLGFGINEVYIMTSGWAFIVPVAAGYLVRDASRGQRTALRVVMMLLTLFLWLYNGSLVVSYFIS